MRRRAFLCNGLALITALEARVSLAKTKNRAAVAIGVDRPSYVQPLKGAASGAKDVADWLAGEGFKVTLLSDAVKPVHLNDVFNSIKSLVDAGTIDQLVVYFAGHGFLLNDDEVWLLSDAPTNASDTIGVNGTKRAAYFSGIPNVIFISDCCRSSSASLGANLISAGGVAFPSPQAAPPRRSSIDFFFAAGVGAAAYEVAVSVRDSTKNYKGIFTSALLDAFHDVPEDLVKTVDGQPVLIDEDLSRVLDEKVPKRAIAAAVPNGQMPDILVRPDPNNYLGRARSVVKRASISPPPTLAGLANAYLRRGLEARVTVSGDPGGFSGDLPQDLSQLSEKSGFANSAQHIISANRQFFGDSGPVGDPGPAPPGFAPVPPDSAFQILGNALKYASSSDPVSVTNTTEDSSVCVVTHGPVQVSSVALRFVDGSGCVLPAIHGFDANVIVDGHGVTNVSYRPRDSNSLPEYEKKQLNFLHATAATAAKYGVFRIQDSGQASRIAATLRMGKMFDITLGVYAAYAYASAGLFTDVRSVESALKSEYGASFFDVSMLAGSLNGYSISKQVWGRSLPNPVIPMLTQGWSLLRANSIKLPTPLEEAATHTLPALWTTFDPRGMDLIEGWFPLHRTAAKNLGET